MLKKIIQGFLFGLLLLIVGAYALGVPSSAVGAERTLQLTIFGIMIALLIVSLLPIEEPSEKSNLFSLATYRKFRNARTLRLRYMHKQHFTEVKAPVTILPRSKSWRRIRSGITVRRS